MQSEWKIKTIEELISQQIIIIHKDGNHGSNYPKVSEFGKEGIPFLTAKLLDDNGHIYLGDAPRLSVEKASKITFGFLETDDVLLSHNATVGRVAVVPKINEKMLIGTSLTHFRLNSSRLLPRYLAVFFSSRNFQNQLAAVMSQSTRNQVPITTQRKLSVVVPPLLTQQKIANILSTLDDKIELNRKMNQTLEEMAQAIFKSWFVDFDPVHAKANCTTDAELEQAAKELGISKEVLELFPSEFEDSELGLIPKGWEAKPLYETAEYINGAAFKVKDFSKNSTGLPIIKIVELKNGITSTTKYTNNDYKDKYHIENGNILYSWSGSPETSLDLFKWFGGNGLLNQHIFKLNFESNEQMHHTYYLLKAIKPLLIETAKQKQTTGLGHITVADMKRIKVPYPDDTILEYFSKTIEPLFQQSSQLLQEVDTLKETRNTLLPKLLSGELDVSDLDI